MERFDQLLAGCFEGLLSEREEEDLAELARNDPALRHRFAAQAEMEGLLRAHMAPNSAGEDLARRVLLCLPAPSNSQRTVDKVMESVVRASVSEPRALASGTAPLPHGRGSETSDSDPAKLRILDWRVWSLAALIILGLSGMFYQAFGGGWGAKSRQELAAMASVATLETCSGKVDLLLAEYADKTPAAAGQMLVSKNGLEVAPSAKALLRYRDKSALELSASSGATRMWLRRLPDYDPIQRGTTLGKRVTLESGVIEADVVKQAPVTPMVLSTMHAEAVVLGTTFKLAVTLDSTRLDVFEGRVQLTRRRDSKSVVVGAKEFAVAGPGELEVKPSDWVPARREEAK